MTSVPLRKQPRIRFQNMWAVDLSSYDVIWCFGVHSFMARLEEKVARECKDDVIVALFRFQLPGVTPMASFGEVSIYQPNKGTALGGRVAGK